MQKRRTIFVVQRKSPSFIYLTMLSVTQTSNDTVIMNYAKGYERKWSWLNLSYCSYIYLELRKITRNLTRTSGLRGEI